MVRSSIRAPLAPAACKITDAENSKTLTTWKMLCSGKRSAEQEVTARFDDPQHYVMVINSRATTSKQFRTSVLTVEGQRKGECPR